MKSWSVGSGSLQICGLTSFIGQIRDLLLCLLFLAARATNAAFTRSAHWKLDDIELTYAGTPCFRPGPNPASTRLCGNSTLIALLDIHIKNDRGPGLSIAYYDLKDRSVLGGASWADWDTGVLPVGVCMSGAVDTLANEYSTICRFTAANDDHDSAAAHLNECTVSRPQMRVTDGCYTPPPRRVRFRLDDSASGILTIIGLIIALPSIAFGAYRWYSARRALRGAQLEDSHALPLVHVASSDGDRVDSHNPSDRDSSHSRGG